MLSRAFYFVFPLLVVLIILAFSAQAEEKSFREAAEKDNIEELAAPDVPDAEAAPERPLPGRVHAAPDHKAGHKTAHKMESYAKATLRGAIALSSTLEKGKETQFTLTLRDAGGQPVPMSGLEERHTKKMHLLVVDASLADYHHLHPEEGKEPGTYVFSFTPHTAYSYIVYADVKPAGGSPQMVAVMLQGADACADACVDKAVVDTAVFEGHKAYLAFAGKTLKAGEDARGELFITDDNDAPFTSLEPVMGAYGHIVGFYEGFGAVMHAHPLGKEPAAGTDRGSSPISFMLHPENEGFLKIFAQIRAGGKDIFLPFSVYVDP